jgi:hypothetical protein
VTTGERIRPVARDLVVALAIGGGLLAIVLAAVVIRPLEAATIDPDAAASVLYFERLVGGTRLEAFVPTTPKPLLTVVYGLAWSALHDWRALVWATIVAFGIAVVLAGWWIARVGRAAAGRSGPWAASAGSIVAASFVMTGLAVSPDLVLEVSRANSLVWALFGWLVAGLAMTGARRHPGLAGAALLVAGLARFETFAIVGAAGLALVAQAILARAGRGRPTAHRDWLVLVGALALPIACVHDLLLTGDPLYWATVPARYTQLYVPGAEPVGPLEYARVLVSRYTPEWPLLALAGIGLATLVARRVWVGVVGLAGLGGGVVVLLFLLAARGTYISARYDEPLDLALLGLAGIGLGALVATVVAAVVAKVAAGRTRSSGRGRSAGELRSAGEQPGWAGEVRSAREQPGWAGVLLAAAGGASLALVAAWPPALLDARVGRELDLVRTASANAGAYMSRLSELAAPSEPADVAGGGSGSGPRPAGAPLADPAGARVFVPSLLRPRIAVEAGAPLTALGDTYAAFVAPVPWTGLHAGQRIYHDRAADRPDALDEALEADPLILGQAQASVELIDDARGVRFLLVRRP